MTDTSQDAPRPQSSSDHAPSDETSESPAQEDPAQNNAAQEDAPQEGSAQGQTVHASSDENEDAEATEGDDPQEESEPSAVEEPAAEEAAASEDSEQPSTASSSPLGPVSTGQIRRSQPTPTLPPAALPDQDEPGLSDFFDQIDEKLTTATGRIAAAFRRPTGEEPPPLDIAYQEPGEVEVWEAEGFQDHTSHAGFFQEDRGLAAAQALSSEEATAPPEKPLPGDELPPPPAPGAHEPPAAHPSVQAYDAAALERQELEAERSEEDALVPPTPDQNAERRFSLPAPPSRAEANRGRRDLDEARRRDVIWEKASAIEAATTASSDQSEDDYADEEEDLYTYIPPYNLPSRDPDPPAHRNDLHRQIFVSMGAVAAVVTSLWMFGVFGAPAILGGGGLDELSEGWFSGDHALLSPGDGFYWLWPLITIGLITHAVHQWTTTQTATPRQRRSGWLVGFASLLVLGWTAAVHFGIPALAALAALAAALALVDALRQFNFHTARNSMERRLTDASVGLFAGWTLVIAMSSVSVSLTALGIRIPGIPAVLWALVGLVICIWVTAFYSMTERGRITVALGMGWGMFWLIFPRLLSEVPSVWVAIGAAMGAFIVILATESRRHRINHAERRAAMGRPVDDII